MNTIPNLVDDGRKYGDSGFTSVLWSRENPGNWVAMSSPTNSSFVCFTYTS